MAPDIRVLPLWMVYVYTLFLSYTVGFPTVYVPNSSAEATDYDIAHKIPAVACPTMSDPVQNRTISQQTADTVVACSTGCLHWSHHEPTIRPARTRNKLALPAMHSATWPPEPHATLSQDALIKLSTA